MSRPLSLLLAAVVVAGLVAGACQHAPLPAPEADLGTLAAQALEARDYARAADLYRRALAGQPEGLLLHYGLGVAASHLGLRDEAVRELTWVLERGEPGSREVGAAEQWLRSAGALRRPGPTTPGPRAPEPELAPRHGALEGRVALPSSPDAPNDVQPLRRKKLALVGQPNTPTEFLRYAVRTDEGGQYRFPNAVPGAYKLTDHIAGPATWRLRVEIRPGETQTMDLTAANRVGVRDDFPN